MRSRSAVPFSNGRRRGRLVLRAVLLACLILALAATAAALRGRELATGLIRVVLGHAGLAPQGVETRSIGFGGIALGAMHLGGTDGPSASGVDIDWTPRSLLHGRLGRVHIEALRLSAAFDDGGIAIAGLPQAGASASGPALPFEQLELNDARITLTASTGKLTASVGARITRGENGAALGQAIVDALVMPASGKAIRVTAEVPELHLVDDGKRLQLGIAHAALALPEWRAALSSVEAAVQLANEDVSLTLAAELRDLSSSAAWVPLAITLEGRRDKSALIVAGRAQTPDRALVLAFSGRHDLASSRGSVTIDAAPVRFEVDGRQPVDLFPIAGRTLRRVGGSVGAKGTLSWRGPHLAATLAVLLDGIGFEDDIAQVSNLDGHVTLDSVVPPHTPGPQHVTANLRIAGLPPGPLDLQFSLPGSDRLLVDRATLGFSGGALSLAGVTLARDRPLDTALEVRAVDLGAVLTLIGIDGLSGSGALDGRIPVRVDLAGAAIVGGRLVATGPGVVRYTGAGLPDAVSGADRAARDTLRLVRQALTDFHYTGLTLTLDRSPDGEGSLMISLKGANPAVLEGYPFAFNIRLDANFDRLATVFLDGYAAANGLLRRAAGQ